MRLAALAAALLPAAIAAARETVRVVREGALPEARQPQIAVDASGRVYVAFGSAGAIYCAVSDDQGVTFPTIVKVADAVNLSLGARRGPRIAVTRAGIAITAVCSLPHAPADVDVRSWRSTDGGAMWTGLVRVNSVAGSGREGLQALAPGPEGDLHCVWLDLRRGRTDLYASRSDDLGATWRENVLVYRSPSGTICECCHPSVAVSEKGIVHVLWRNFLEGARDLYLAASADGGRSFGKPSKLGHETWKLSSCPMDGGALATDAAGGAIAVWMRKGEIFLTTPSRAERLLGKGGQPWLASGPEGIYSVWLERGTGSLLALRPRAAEPLRLATQAADPVIAGARAGRGPVVVAWESDEDGRMTILSRTLAFRNP
jgi:hypothetical protein